MFFKWNCERVKWSTAMNYCNHVAYLCEVQHGIPAPVWTRWPLFHRVRQKAKRQNTTRKRKQPVTWGIASDVTDTYDFHPDSITSLSGAALFICILLLGVAGLFRLGELIPQNIKKTHPERILRRGQIQFFRQAGVITYARIWLYRSKGDTYSEGVPVFIPANSTSRRLCPIAWLEAILRLTKTPQSSDSSPLFIFPNGTLVTRGPFIRWMKGKLRGIGFDPSLYAGHSLRIGGAVTAARAGVPHHVIQRLGRWRSQAYLLYIKYVPERIQNLRDTIATLQTVQRSA